MRRALLAIGILALAACDSSSKSVKVDTHAKAATLPAPPAMVICDVEMPQKIASEVVASKNIPFRVHLFWEYAVVSKALRDSGVTLSDVELDLARKEILAEKPIARIEMKTGEPTYAQSLEDLGLTAEYEQNWLLTARAGITKLGNVIETVNAGTLTATETELAEAKRVAFGETADILDFICMEKLEATQIVADFKNGMALTEVGKNHKAFRLLVSKLDKRIAEDFQTEIWTTLKAAPGAFSSEAKYDKRGGNWHVIYIRGVNPAREPSTGELRALKNEIAERKGAVWTQEQLKKFKIASLPSVAINDPQLKRVFESQRENLFSPPSTTPAKSE